MEKRSDQLPRRFHALGDPTRLAIVERLAAGPASVSTLAAPAAMALPAFLKHLAVLERTGIISSSKIGRVRTCRLEPQALADLDAWLSDRRRLWAQRLERLAGLVDDGPDRKRE